MFNHGATEYMCRNMNYPVLQRYCEDLCAYKKNSIMCKRCNCQLENTQQSCMQEENSDSLDITIPKTLCEAIDMSL